MLSLIRQHGDAIEADLAFRGFDLLDLWRGKLSPRKVDVLIRGLPPDSATRIALNDGKPLPSTSDVMTADLIDAVNANTAMTLAVATGKPYKEPPRYPRWWAKTAEKFKVTADMLRKFRERTRG